MLSVVLKRIGSSFASLRSSYRALFAIWWAGWFVRLALPVILGVGVGRVLGGESAVLSFWAVFAFFVANEFLFRGAIAFALPLVLFVLSCLLFLLVLALPILFNYVAGASETARLVFESRYPGFLFLVDDVDAAFGVNGAGISWWLVAFYFCATLIYLSLSVDWYDDLQHFVSRRTRAASPLWMIGLSLCAFVSAGDLIGLPGGVWHLLTAAVGTFVALAFSAGSTRILKILKVYGRLWRRGAGSAGSSPPGKASRPVARAAAGAPSPASAPAVVPAAVTPPSAVKAAAAVVPSSADSWSDDEYEIPDATSVVDLSGPVSLVVGEGVAGATSGDRPFGESAVVHAVGGGGDGSASMSGGRVDPDRKSGGVPPIPARTAIRASTNLLKDEDVRYDRSEEDPEAQALRVLNYMVSAMDTADWNLMFAASETVAGIWRTALGMPSEDGSGSLARPSDADRTLAISVLSEIWKRPLGEDFVRAMYRWDDLDPVHVYLMERREAGSDLSVRSAATIDMEMVPLIVAPRANADMESYEAGDGDALPRDRPDDLGDVDFMDLGHEDVMAPPGSSDHEGDGDADVPVEWSVDSAAASRVRSSLPPLPSDDPDDSVPFVPEPVYAPAPVQAPMHAASVPPVVAPAAGRPVTREPPVPVPAAPARRSVPIEPAPYVRVSEEVSYVMSDSGDLRGVGPDGDGVEDAVGHVEFHVAEGVAGGDLGVAGSYVPESGHAAHVQSVSREAEADPSRIVVDVSMDEFLVRQQAMDLPQLQAILQSDEGELAMPAATFAQRFRTRLVAVGFDPASMDSFLKYVDKLAFHHDISTGEDVRAFLFGLVDLFPTSDADRVSARERMAYVFCDSWRRETHSIVERLLSDPSVGRRSDIGGEEVDALIRTMERMGRIFIADPTAQSQFSMRVERLRDLRSKLFGDGPAKPVFEARVDDLRVGTGLALRGDLDHPAQTDLDDFLALAQAHRRIEDMIARDSLYSGREALLHPLQITVKDLEVQGSRVLVRLSAAADRLRDRRKMSRSAPLLDRLIEGQGDDATLFRQIVDRQKEELGEDFVPTADRLARMEADLDAVRLGVASQRAAEAKGLRERVEEQWVAHSSDPFSAIARRLEAQSADMVAVSSEWRLLDLRERSLDGLRVFTFEHGSSGDRVVLVPVFGFGVPWVRRGDLFVSEVDGLCSFDLRSFVRSHRQAFAALQPSDVKMLLFAGELSRHADSDLLSSRLQPPSSGVISSEYARHDSDWWRGCVVLRDDLVGLGRGVDRRSGMASHLSDLLSEPKVAAEIPA